MGINGQKEVRMSEGKKPGRPEKKQVRPLIFERVRSRVSRQVTMSAKTAASLDRYVKWAAAAAEEDEDEALTLTMDQAIGQFLQRDRLFQESLEDRTETGNAIQGSAPHAATPLVAGATRTGT